MSRRIVARALASVMLLIAPILHAGSVAGSAHAQPGAPDSPAGFAVTWQTLGLASTVNLYGDGESTFTVSVPPGLTAARLQGMVHTPTNITDGYVEIEDREGRFLASIELPPATPGSVMAPFDVDISAAAMRNSSIGLSFAIRSREDRDRVCDPPPQLELSNLVTVFAGQQLPVTTLANFFAPAIGGITIYTPTDANSSEQQAVLTMASALARLYSGRPLSIDVVRQARGAAPPPASGFDRAVVVETGEPGLTVENAGAPTAYLRVSGDDEELAKQVSLITTQLQPLVQVSTARVEQAGSDARPTENTLTFKQLNVGGERTNILGTSNLQIGIQRASLGPRFDKLQVQLLADYTPVPAHDAASVVIRMQELVVYRASLDNSGHLDATFELDATDLTQQWLNLDFTLTYTPDQPCGPLLAPITFQIDPGSTLTMHRGGPPPGGFGAFPTEFNNKFLVALDGSGPNQLNYAAWIVAAVARYNKTEMTPEVVDLRTAADSTSGALIIANSDAVKQTSLTPPVSGDGSIVNFALPTELQVDIAQGLGTIQAFADPQRDRSVVLVTTTGDWALVDPLFAYIDGSTGDWSQLTGDVLAAGAAGTPTDIAIRTAGSAFEPIQTDTPIPWLNPYVVACAIAAIAALAVLLFLVWRRSRRPREPVGAHSADFSD